MEQTTIQAWLHYNVARTTVNLAVTVDTTPPGLSGLYLEARLPAEVDADKTIWSVESDQAGLPVETTTLLNGGADLRLFVTATAGGSAAKVHITGMGPGGHADVSGLTGEPIEVVFA